MNINKQTNARGHLLTGVTSLITGLSFLAGMIVYVSLFALGSYGDTTQAVMPQLRLMTTYSSLLYLWYFVIYIVFGLALMGFQIGIKQYLLAGFLRSFTLILGYLWAGLTIATGMLANVGTHMILELMTQHQELAISQWYSLQMLINGFGGGNELVGGVWLIAIGFGLDMNYSIERWLRAGAIVFGCIGVLTAVPMMANLGSIFGIGSTVWFLVMGGYKLMQYKQDIAYV